MMKHYLTDKQNVQDRQLAIQKTADMQRLAHIAQRYRPGLTVRLLAGLGEFMIESGMRLKTRYDAQTQMNGYDAQNAKFKVIGY
ncbi:MAG TPA: hypothetical protein VLK33_15000 [Terriglobales bacterium]|nr:hypothetical protein [Terriglobales bacterium]